MVRGRVVGWGAGDRHLRLLLGAAVLGAAERLHVRDQGRCSRSVADRPLAGRPFGSDNDRQRRPGGDHQPVHVADHRGDPERGPAPRRRDLGVLRLGRRWQPAVGCRRRGGGGRHDGRRIVRRRGLRQHLHRAGRRPERDRRRGDDDPPAARPRPMDSPAGSATKSRRCHRPVWVSRSRCPTARAGSSTWSPPAMAARPPAARWSQPGARRTL